MGRDHSSTCRVCGDQYGGINNYECDCDRRGRLAHLTAGTLVFFTNCAAAAVEEMRCRLGAQRADDNRRAREREIHLLKRGRADLIDSKEQR